MMDGKARLFSSYVGWPSVIDLKCGGSITLERRRRSWRIKLLSVRAGHSSDWRTGALSNGKMVKEAKVLLEIDGRQCVLRAAPYEPPMAFQGLRLYVEMTKAFNSANAHSKEDFSYDARISAVLESEPWISEPFRFPLQGHVWRGNGYANVWNSLVPGPDSRYCLGEDFGAAPGTMNVVSCLPGVVKESPLPGGPSKSNKVVIEHSPGIQTAYGHMDFDSIPFRIVPGASVEAGDLIGKCGCSSHGGRRPDGSPRLHFSLRVDGAHLSPYPFLVESYLRDFPDNALPCAGADAFCNVGERVSLDSSGSVIRAGRSVAGVKWILSDGSSCESASAEIKYLSPGFHSEELRLTLDNGEEFRDAVRVRAFKAGVKGQAGFKSWLCQTPLRGVKPGSEVSYKLMDAEGVFIESVDFGDGSEPLARPHSGELSHSYSSPGVYTVDLKGSFNGAPLQLKIFTRVAAG